MIGESPPTAAATGRAAPADLHGASSQPLREARGLQLAATGEAIPGDPQHSCRNILRYGSEPACLRENCIPPPRH